MECLAVRSFFKHTDWCMNRSYQPLARRYRPRNFAELVGQKTVGQALQGSLRLNRLINSVIFAGIRGTGKTTLARILAKAVNCERRENGDPCADCSSCLAIARGNHEDVLEIDGASNTGVDDIRELQESLAYVPQRSKYKVYIIDEVHMLSISAFNALLKTLEEPRPQVIFIFATTELGKIPRTVRSRCQVFNLTRLSVSSIRDHLKVLLDNEKVTYDEGAIELLASWSEGSMRDALTMLDQAILLGDGTVKYQNIQNSTNLDPSQVMGLLKSLVDKDGQHLIKTLAVIDDSGVEFKKVCERLAGYARHAFIIKDLGKQSLGQQVSEEVVDVLRTIANDSAPLDLNRIFRFLVRCSKELDGSLLDRYVFENYCLEWCFDPGFPSYDQLISGSKTSPPPVPKNTTQFGNQSTIKAQATIDRQTTSASSPLRIAVDERFPASWRELVDEWKKDHPFSARKLEEVKLVTYRPDFIELAVPNNNLISRVLLKKNEIEKLERGFIEKFGFHGKVSVVLEEKHHSSKQSLLEIKKSQNFSQREKLVDEAKKHPLTKEIVKKFDAEITDANLEDS